MFVVSEPVRAVWVQDQKSQAPVKEQPASSSMLSDHISFDDSLMLSDVYH